MGTAASHTQSLLEVISSTILGIIGSNQFFFVFTPPTLPFSSFGLLSGQSTYHCRKLGAKEFSKIQILACRRDPDPSPAGALALAFEPRVP